MPFLWGFCYVRMSSSLAVPLLRGEGGGEHRVSLHRFHSQRDGGLPTPPNSCARVPVEGKGRRPRPRGRRGPPPATDVGGGCGAPPLPPPPHPAQQRADPCLDLYSSAVLPALRTGLDPLPLDVQPPSKGVCSGVCRDHVDDRGGPDAPPLAWPPGPRDHDRASGASILALARRRRCDTRW